jgi:hypothetical protein
VDLADDPSSIQLVLGFDHDDQIGLTHFTDVIQPLLDSKDIAYEAIGFESMEYAGLNRYYNHMAAHTDAEWLFVWNDDAVMHTQGWDTVINLYSGQFRLLKVHTHNDHPYSIFPIVPVSWYKQTGFLSRHQMIDAELSQMAFMLDLMEVISVDVTHDQSELTGNKDETSERKIRFEGNPANQYDFHNPKVSVQRLNDCEEISKYMKSINLDTTFWENVKSGKQYPWERLIELDVNKQMSQFTMKVNDQGQVTSYTKDPAAEKIKHTKNA